VLSKFESESTRDKGALRPIARYSLRTVSILFAPGVFAQAGDNDKAIAEITESYKLAPNEEWVLVERAIAYEKLGKNDLAELDRKVMKDKGYPEWNLKE